MLRNTIFGLAVAITMVLAASASDSALARDLNDALRGKEFTLRVPDAAKSIEFDSDRHRVGDAVPGDWFQHMRLQVAEVKVENQSVLLETKRVVIAFDPQKGTFSDFPSGDKLQLKVRLPSGAATARDVTSVLDKIFLPDSTQLAQIAPRHWEACMERVTRDKARKRWFCEGKVATSTSTVIANLPATLSPSAHADSNGAAKAVATAPRAIYAPDPDYTRLAKNKNKEGMCLLWVVITPQGTTDNIRIASPIGYGLDDEAVRAVRRWRFNPATKDGQPVAVQINIEINFIR